MPHKGFSLDKMRFCFFSGAECNRSAMEIVRKVAAEGDALTAASINREGLEMGKAEAQENFRRQAKIFIEGEIDFIICEGGEPITFVHSRFDPMSKYRESHALSC